LIQPNHALKSLQTYLNFIMIGCKLAKEFDRAYNIWGSKVFGQDLSDDVADIMEKWGNVLSDEPKLQ